MAAVEPSREAPEEEPEAEPGDGETGGRAEPRIEALGHDVSGGIEDHQPQQEHSDGVGGSDHEPQEHGVARGPTRTHEIGGHDRLAVSGFERMQGAHTQRRRHGQQEDADAQLLGGHELREGRARRGSGRGPGHDGNWRLNGLRRRHRRSGVPRARCLTARGPRWDPTGARGSRDPRAARRRRPPGESAEPPRTRCVRRGPGGAVQQVGRVVAQRPTPILFGNGAGGEAGPRIGDGDDLLPARAAGKVLVAIAQLVEWARRRRVQVDAEHRAEPHRRQVSRAGDKAHVACGRPEHAPRPVDLDVESFAKAVRRAA